MLCDCICVIILSKRRLSISFYYPYKCWKHLNVNWQIKTKLFWTILLPFYITNAKVYEDVWMLVTLSDMMEPWAKAISYIVVLLFLLTTYEVLDKWLEPWVSSIIPFYVQMSKLKSPTCYSAHYNFSCSLTVLLLWSLDITLSHQ